MVSFNNYRFRRLLFPLSIVIEMMIPAYHLSAQTPDRENVYENSFFVVAGAGISTMKSVLYLNGEVVSEPLRKMAVIGGAETVLYFSLFGTDSHNLYSFYCGVGPIFKREHGFTLFTISPQYVNTNYHSTYERWKRSEGFGVKFQSHIGFSGRHVAFVITPFASINTEKNYGGLSVNIALGKIL